jgi:lipoprotein-anchoring transpeptidase ErfK/SrfK
MQRPGFHACILNASFFLLAATGSAVAAPLMLDPPRYVEPRVAAAPLDQRPQMQLAAAQPNMGGGFLEFLFSGGNVRPAPQYPAQQPAEPYFQSRGEPAQPGMDPRYLKQAVQYDGHEKPGTIVIDTRSKFLYLVEDNGEALRYGVGVGKPGFLWAGVKTITRKREWPDWTPPAEMLQRRPDLPRHMEGGPENPLGARAMYLGSSLYRIHGSNEPWTIGTNVSSGCIRMRNEDVVDLYERVRVGTKVVVM